MVDTSEFITGTEIGWSVLERIVLELSDEVDEEDEGTSLVVGTMVEVEDEIPVGSGRGLNI